MSVSRIQIFAFLLLVSVSGCSGLPTDVFGSDVLSVQTSVAEDSVKDVVSMKDTILIPSPPLLPDQAVWLSFGLENNDDVRTAQNVMVDLFNAPLFRSAPQFGSGAPCNSARNTCLPEGGKCSIENACSLLPGEEAQINFNLRSPTEADIAGIKTETALDYKVSYDFTSAFLYSIPVVSETEITKLQRSQDTLTVSVQKSHSSGPIKIDADLQGASYILPRQGGVINFRLQNRGSGTVRNSSIELVTSDISSGASANIKSILDRFLSLFTGSFSEMLNSDIRGIILKFPDDFKVTEPEGFKCGLDNVCFNTKPIQLFRDESRVSMRFQVSLNPGALAEFERSETPFRSYQILALVGYTYELRNSLAATINPFHNVG